MSDRTDSDIEPPDFDAPLSVLDTLIAAADVVGPAAPCRPKSSSRPAPSAFTSPICIGMYKDEWGHLDVSAQMFWAGACAYAVPVHMDDMSAVYEAAQCALPAGAYWRPTSQQDAATAEYIDFTAQTLLVVWPGVSMSVLREACSDDPGAIAMAIMYDDNECIYGEAGADATSAADIVSEPAPGPRKLAGSTMITLRSPADSAWVAQRLLFNGVCAMVSFPSGARPVVRTQCVNLHWIKDSEAMQVLTRFADTLAPTLTRDLEPGTIPSLQGLMYDNVAETGSTKDAAASGSVCQELNMRRDNLNWSAFATQYVMTTGLSFSRRREASVHVLARTFEPLASYARTLLHIHEVRAADERERAVLSPPSMPAYNVATKMTAAQITHILQLYYWAVVHVDAATARVPRAAARAGLELYLRFGAAVVKRRAYVFHTNTGKRRRAHSTTTTAEEPETNTTT